MGYSSVQLIGKDAAVKAFENTDCVNWSLMQGKQFLFKYEGADSTEAIAMLKELLTMISQSSGSEAVYTIRFYEREDLPAEHAGKPVKNAKPVKKFKIYERTEYDGSFNFKLFDIENELGPRRIGSTYNELTEMKAQFAEMKTMITEMIKERNAQDAEDEKEKVSGIAGMFNGLLEMPEVKQAIAGKVVQIFHGLSNKISGMITPAPQPAKIAGPDAEPIQMSQDQVNKLNSALTILAKIDQNLPANLYKLATIAQNEPGTYAMLINMLNAKQ